MTKRFRFVAAFFFVLLSIAGHALLAFPSSMMSTFGFKHGEGSDQIVLTALFDKVPGHVVQFGAWSHEVTGIPALIIATLLIAAAPISAAVLVLIAPPTGRTRTLSASVTLLAYAAWTSYYIGSYHAPLLVLAVLAWYLATQHVREIMTVNDLVERSKAVSEASNQNLDRIDRTVSEIQFTVNDLGRQTIEQQKTLVHVGEVVESSQALATSSADLLKALERHVKNLQDTAGTLRHTSIRGFYETFGPKVEVAKRTIVSVERRWTWEKRSWARIPIDECNGDAPGFAVTVNEVRRCSLHRALVATGASRCLYIGPWPIRDSTKGYGDDEFGQLLALIHTMCVCEIAKHSRASMSDSRPIRLHVAVADVPTWVKIVDSDYWLLQGESLQPLQTTYCPEPLSGDQLARRHASRLSAQFDIVETYNRNARRGHEHVLALILEHATILYGGNLTGESSVAGSVGHDLERIVRSIKGGLRTENPFSTYLSQRNADMTAKHIVHLFRLFLALHFLGDDRPLSGESLSDSLHSLRYSSIWNRIA